MTVSGFAMFCMFIALIASIAIPLAMLILLPGITGGERKYFWIGCLIVFLFALTLESLFHQYVNGTAVGETIWNTPVLYALYGGLMAGLFEETGRFLAFRVLMKKGLDNDGNAFTYAAGHAGFEMFAILFFGMVNNLTYSFVMKNPVKMEQVYEHATSEQAEQIRAVYEQLSAAPAWTYLLSMAERGSAILLQFGLTVFVWFAVKKGGKKLLYWPLAILLHMAVDSSMVMIHQASGNAIITELYVFVAALITDMLALKLWKHEKRSND